MKKVLILGFIVIICLMFIGRISSKNVTDNTTTTNAELRHEEENNTENTESLSQESSKTDKEILSALDHPMYLGDLSEAKSFWKDEMSSGKVKEIGIWENIYSDDVLLSFVSYDDEETDSEYLGQIRFYFDHCDEKIKLDEALKIIESYLPENIINQYYNETESYFERDDEYQSINYWKYYDLKDENENHPERVDIHFVVSVWTDLEGNATEANIGVVIVTEYIDGVTENWDYKFFG